MTKNIKDSDETKRKILQAAKKEFSEKGFDGARMSSIAARASVNQALLHYHFETKENLYHSIFQTVLSDDIDKITGRIRDEISSWETTPEIELASAIYLLVKSHIEVHDEDLSRIFTREVAEDKGIIQDFARKYMMPRIMLFNGIVMNGINKGVFEISNSLMFTFSILSFISDYVHGEQFVRGTRWHKTMYRNKQETLFNYMMEQSFKALAPAGSKLEIPVIPDNFKARIEYFVQEIINLYTIR